jgi:histidyl-tRNA synthetase
LQTVISLLRSVGIETEIDTNLVRGLDYYTGVVFEYHFGKTEGVENVGALGGGGHYANLLAEVGGPNEEGIGLAFGVERLAYIIKSVLNPDTTLTPDVYLMGMTDEIIEQNFVLADLLRGNAFSVEMNYTTKSMSSLFKTASRKGAKFAIIVGEDEMAKKEVAIKNLKTQEQTLVKLEDLDNVLHTLLEKYYVDRDAEEAKGE